MPRRRPNLAVVTLWLFAGGCGGKVVFDGGAGGSGGSGTVTTGSAPLTTGTSSGGPACLTAATSGAGPLGPSVLEGTKCFSWPTKMQCPSSVEAGSHITPDPCYGLKLVKERCLPKDPGQCCYEVTEELVCEG